MLLKPLPMGVVSGPFIATLFFLIDSKTSSGSGVPYLSMTSAPASTLSQFIFASVASTATNIASVISGPIPSPGIKVMLCILFLHEILIGFYWIL